MTCVLFLNVIGGVRQGWALSAMLYTLAIELLLIRLRKELHGVTIHNYGNGFQVCQHLQVMLQCVCVSCHLMLNIYLKVLEPFSSAKVNWSKSVYLCWLGGGQTESQDYLTLDQGGVEISSPVFLGDGMFIQKNLESSVEKNKGTP